MRIAPLLVIALVGCTPYDPTLSSSPFNCGSAEPVCPDGYECMGTVCTNTTAPPSTCTMAFTGVLATWSMVGEPGSQSQTAAFSSAPGVVATSIVRAAPLIVADGIGSINASNWSTDPSPDLTKYFTISIDPAAGCALVVTSVDVDAKSSTTGPLSASLATSVDAFAATSPVSTAMPTTVTTMVTDKTGALEIRIYGYSAAAMTGTLRVQNKLTVSGALQ